MYIYNDVDIWWKEINLSIYFWSYILVYRGLSWSWSFGSWIYNYICTGAIMHCPSPQFGARSWQDRGVHDTTLFYKVCQWLATGRWFFPGTPDSSTNKTDHHDITEILLKRHKPKPRIMVWVTYNSNHALNSCIL